MSLVDVLPILFTIRHEPVAKPRGRQLCIEGPGTPPGVVAWRSFKAAALEAALKTGWRWADPEPLVLLVASYHAIPSSWSRRRKLEALRAWHRQKPDGNHVWNAVADALWPKDERISTGLCVKRWDDGAGPRVVVYAGLAWPDATLENFEAWGICPGPDRRNSC